MKKAIALITSLLLVCGNAYAEKLVTIKDFKGLERTPNADKIEDMSHAKMDFAFVDKGPTLRVIKGRDRLNSTAAASTTVNGLVYYESSTGTKKYVVKEGTTVASYDTDWTNRTSLATGLTDEKVTFKQIGDSLYMDSVTDGLYKWSGSGSIAAVGSVSAPSSVDFSATTGFGGLTPGVDGVVGLIPIDSSSDAYSFSGGTCTEVGSIAGYTVGFHSKNAASISGLNTSLFNAVDATSTTYQYKVTKYSSKWGIESEPSSADSATLKGNDKVTVSLKDPTTRYNSGCSSYDQYYGSADIVYSNAQTRTTGTLASAPSAPFDSYRIYRTVAGGSDFFLLGEQTTGAYTDGKPDVSLIDHPLDTTIDTISPPAARYIEAYKGVLFIGNGSIIRFTRLPVSISGADTYWLDTDQLTLDVKESISGMKSVKDELLIFTPDRTYGLSGFGVGTFRLKQLANGIGAASNETIEVDTNGDVIFFAGTSGVYKAQVGSQLSDSLTGAQIGRSDTVFKRISSPVLDSVFQGKDSQIVLDPTDYSTSHAYYDSDNDLYHLFIGSDEFIYNNITSTWSHVPATKMLGSVYRKSPNAQGQGLVIDNDGFAWNDWKTYRMAPGGTVTGSPTSSTNTTLTDSGATFYTTNDGLKGVWVAVVSSDGTIQYRQISSNTGTALTVGTAWGTNPTTSDTYYIGYLIFDVLTKQYSLAEVPNETDLQAVTLVYELAPSTQNLIVSNYLHKSSTPQSTTFTIDLSGGSRTGFDKYLSKIGIGGRSIWNQVGFRSYVYNSSDTIVPPVSITAYTFHANAKEHE